MTALEQADKLDAIATLEELADNLADERVAWERLARSTPAHLPHIAMTCNEVASTADHGYKWLVRLSVRLAKDLADVDIADAYIDAARLQLEQLRITRGSIGSIIRPAKIEAAQ